MSATDVLPSAAPVVAANPPADSFGQRLVPAGDPLSGATFDAIFEGKIKPELIKCEAGRKSAMRTFFLAVAAGLLLIFLEFAVLPSLIHRGPPDWVWIITGVGALIIGYLPVQAVANTAKKGVIQALCEPIAVNYQLSGGTPPAFDTFLKLRLLPSPSDKSFEDFFSGRRGDVDFSLCEARLTQGSGKNRHTVFAGQIFRLTMPKKRLATTVVLRNIGWFKHFECPKGLEPVGLEDPVFNKAFAVFGNDQVEAREILTPTFMQHLVDLETAYKGGHIRYAFTDADLLIALESSDRYEIGHMFSTLVERKRVEGIAHDLEQLFKLVDAFAVT